MKQEQSPKIYKVKIRSDFNPFLSHTLQVIELTHFQELEKKLSFMTDMKNSYKEAMFSSDASLVNCTKELTKYRSEVERLKKILKTRQGK